VDTLTHYPESPSSPFISFLGAPRLSDARSSAAQFAVIGAPFGVPYTIRQMHSGAGDAPRAIRERSARFGAFHDRYDFDLGGSLDRFGPLPLVDCGDVRADPRALSAAAAHVTAAVTAQLAAGRLPIVLGGDDSISALSLRGFEHSGPIEVLQIDAHIDYRDEVNGIRDGYSSPMRRASEMPWVRRIIHVGTRGVGSARPQDVRDTLAAGNQIVSARVVAQQGAAAAVLRHFTPGARYYVAFDCDGMDPSVMPGTSAPMPGGLAYDTVVDIIHALAKQGNIVGINFAEHYPSLDVNGITALAITRIIVNLIGATLAQRDATRGTASASPQTA
jgi:agmatinase